MPRRSTAIRDALRQKIANGEYSLEEIIALKSYKELTLHSGGTLKEEYFGISGRKIPQLEIRKNLLDEHEQESF